MKCETGVYAENTGTTPARLQIQLAVILEADMLVSSMTEVSESSLRVPRK